MQKFIDTPLGEFQLTHNFESDLCLLNKLIYQMLIFNIENAFLNIFILIFINTIF